jgi:hypothetical protein
MKPKSKSELDSNSWFYFVGLTYNLGVKWLNILNQVPLLLKIKIAFVVIKKIN